jgi:hypothetical protein
MLFSLFERYWDEPRALPRRVHRALPTGDCQERADLRAVTRLVCQQGEMDTSVVNVTQKMSAYKTPD